MRAPISHLHKSSMHRQGYRAWGNGGDGKVEAQREQRSTYQSTLTTCPVFFLYAKPESIPHPCPLHPGSYTFTSLLYAVQSLSLTQKGFCHLLSALSLTRREHIKVRLKPQEGRDQSLALISSGMRQIDEDLKKGGGLLKDRSAVEGGRGGEPEICLSISQMLYMDTEYCRDTRPCPEVFLLFDYFITISKEYMNDCRWTEKQKGKLSCITFYIAIFILLQKPQSSFPSSVPNSFVTFVRVSTAQLWQSCYLKAFACLFCNNKLNDISIWL